MYCKECRYFGEELIAYEHSDKPTPSGYHPCDYIKHGGGSVEDLVNREAIENVAVIDGSGYFAAIRVKEDFGCVNFTKELEG